jgi:Membrane bound O-acyl transferase family
VLDLVGASLNAGGRVRRGLGVVLSLSAMGTAWLLPPRLQVLRCFSVLLTFVSLMRNVDLLRVDWPLGRRLVHVLSIVDTRRLTPVPPGLDKDSLIAAVGWNALAWPVYYLVLPLASRFTGAGYWAFRWSAALVFIYAVSAGAYPLGRLVYRAIGFTTPPLHVAPAAAKSVQEFWGERWNRIVSGWLGDTFFRPLARRRHPLIGALLAFIASALLHAYLIFVVAPVFWALVTLAFFVLQAFIIGAEKLLKIRTWRPWAAHAWTIAWMVGLSPMFSEPGMRAIGV